MSIYDEKIKLTDEAMAKIMAKKEGWENSRLFHGCFIQHDTKDPGEIGCVADPRTDIGAALDLFHWSIFGGVNDFIVRPFKGGWEIFNEDNEETFAFIETSDFCNGVCDLASRATGIK